MTRRLTDSELQSAIGFCERGQIERPLLALRTSLDDDMSKALLGVLVELRERRQADLTAEDVEALRAVLGYVQNTRGMERGAGVLCRFISAAGRGK